MSNRMLTARQAQAIGVATAVYLIALVLLRWLVWLLPAYAIGIALLAWRNWRLRGLARSQPDATPEPGVSITAVGSLVAAAIVLVAIVPLSYLPNEPQQVGPEFRALAFAWLGNHVADILSSIAWVCAAIVAGACVDMLRPGGKKLVVIAVSLGIVLSGFSVVGYVRHREPLLMARAIHEMQEREEERRGRAFKDTLALVTEVAVSVDDFPVASDDGSSDSLKGLRKVWEYPLRRGERIRPLFGPFVHGKHVVLLVPKRQKVIAAVVLDRARGTLVKEIPVSPPNKYGNPVCVQENGKLYAGRLGDKYVSIDLDDLSVEPFDYRSREDLWPAEIIVGARASFCLRRAHKTLWTVPPLVDVERSKEEGEAARRHYSPLGVFDVNAYVAIRATKDVESPLIEGSFTTECWGVAVAAADKANGALRWRTGLLRGKGDPSVWLGMSGEGAGATFLYAERQCLAVNTQGGGPLWRAPEMRALGTSGDFVFLLEGWERGKMIAMRHAMTGALAGRLRIDHNVSLKPQSYEGKYNFIVGEDEVVLFLKSKGEDILTSYRRD